ncbi:hypothetical protein SAMN06264365_11150 [Actinoplanes regularis]|uniref:Uncharacterized protein n=2 Tax=Actinoplanes regularis TaxID=52697 RepID=A0A239CB40_9ACTN|nr:hypothetical protein [Actinoplanes regularis]GIE89518.1 hypothetical protein Are01nite_59980 [Actinoplanes regularis]SNS16664.1 hypothetical protein SAMN06264365_11150 [Actinoplanes regularis]
MLTDDELRAVLRAEAAAHRPDRAAILERATRTTMRNEAARRRGPRVRIAGAAAAVAAVIGGGGVAQWALAGGTGSDRPTPPPPPVTVSASPAVAPSASPSRSSPSRRPGKPTAPSVASAEPAADTTAMGPLRSGGSVEVGGKTRANSVVTIRTGEALTALEVTIRLAGTAGLVPRSGSQQVPGASVDSSVTEEAGALVYHFTLSSGDTLDPGTYTFYARYTYAPGGRDPGADRYAVTATSGSGAALTVGGGFG